jgi:hypothetical protein
MRLQMCFLAACVLLCPQAASAQMQPHRAEYVLRLGAAANAPRVGAATEELTLDCAGWHLKRDVKGEIPISATWKFSLASILDSDENRSGDNLRYRSIQVQNGAEHEVIGKVQRASGELRAEIESPDGARQIVLPALTRMPVASIGYIIGQLQSGTRSFSTLSFDAQGSGDTFRVDVAQIDKSALRRRPPLEEPVAVPGRDWPVRMRLTRETRDPQQPLFAVSAQLSESGVLDHVTVEANVVTIAADLKALQLLPSPSCQ